MKYWLLLCVLLLGFETARAQGSLPVLEQYAFDVQDWSSAELEFLDKKISTGGAQFRLQIRNVNSDTIEVHLAVFRHIVDRIAFALLLEEIRVRFVDASGKVVKSFTLDQVLGENGLFIIGDSQDGYFEHRRRLKGGLRNATRLEVELLGNFE